MWREEAGTASAEEQQFCTFHVDHLLIGIEVGRVQEVVRRQPTTLVPLGPVEVKGLINLRGQIVTAIDVRRWLALDTGPSDEEAMNAVVRLEDEVVSLLVDRAGEVVAPPLHAHEPVPPTAPERIRALFSGTYKLAEGLLLVLDLDEIGAIGRGQRETTLRRSA